MKTIKSKNGVCTLNKISKSEVHLDGQLWMLSFQLGFFVCLSSMSRDDPSMSFNGDDPSMSGDDPSMSFNAVNHVASSGRVSMYSVKFDSLSEHMKRSIESSRWSTVSQYWNWGHATLTIQLRFFACQYYWIISEGSAKLRLIILMYNCKAIEPKDAKIGKHFYDSILIEY